MQASWRILSLLALVLVSSLSARGDNPPALLNLTLRSRVQAFKGSPEWDEVSIRRPVPAAETALLICDMWDNHWCKAAAQRCDALARKLEPVLQATRAKGVTIIHAPSDCMEFYKDYPQRQLMKVLAVDLPPPLAITEPALPINDSDGGCDDSEPSKTYRAWTRQHPALTIAAGDVISDSGREIYGYLRKQKISNLLVCGVHTNMCVLNRTFAIKTMTRSGLRCVLVRDLTDAMYNPHKEPFVTHERGTELVIQHIEKFWCPSILSQDLLP